ncbi:hypothetical protein [Chryseobacterium schmidteae]|uniref:hypothetical protein n=1 Tax=Chryseobacterium schmidteae TaxID=2730404 RepID=UPI00158C58C6
MFKEKFKKSEFHFLQIDENIVSLARINFDFKFKIESKPYQFAEFVGFVSIEKNKGYGTILVEKTMENLREKNIEAIGFCEKDLRLFYEKTSIKILYDKADYFLEFDNNEWIKSTDNDILILNASKKTIDLLQNLEELNPAFLI